MYCVLDIWLIPLINHNSIYEKKVNRILLLQMSTECDTYFSPIMNSPFEIVTHHLKKASHEMNWKMTFYPLELATSKVMAVEIFNKPSNQGGRGMEGLWSCGRGYVTDRQRARDSSKIVLPDYQ